MTIPSKPGPDELKRYYASADRIRVFPAWLDEVEKMVWMDALDSPLVRLLKADFFERYAEGQQPVLGVGGSARRYAAGALLPAWEDSKNTSSTSLCAHHRR